MNVTIKANEPYPNGRTKVFLDDLDISDHLKSIEVSLGVNQLNMVTLEIMATALNIDIQTEEVKGKRIKLSGDVERGKLRVKKAG
jgi:hypothetical protein